MSEVKPGDIVEVTYKGMVTSTAHGIRLKAPNGQESHHTGHHAVRVVESAFQVGALYEDADGDKMIRTADHRWYSVEDGETLPNTWATRPLKRLYPTDEE